MNDELEAAKAALAKFDSRLGQIEDDEIAAATAALAETEKRLEQLFIKPEAPQAPAPLPPKIDPAAYARAVERFNRGGNRK